MKNKKGLLITGILLLLIAIVWQFFSDRDQTVIFESRDPIQSTGSSDDLSGDEQLELPKETSRSEIASTETAVETKPEPYPVYLVGAVNNPGIYQIDNRTFLYELVEKAGGFKADAAAEQINLAARVAPNQIIRIPTLEEWQQNPQAGFFEELTMTAETIVADRTIGDNGSNSQRININTATAGELEQLPGIGPVTAGIIIEYREHAGPFQRIEEIMQVNGIKESRFASIKDLIRVS